MSTSGRARPVALCSTALLRDSRARRLLAGLAVSSLGDGMSIVTIAWLALAIAPSGDAGVYVG